MLKISDYLRYDGGPVESRIRTKSQIDFWNRLLNVSLTPPTAVEIGIGDRPFFVSEVLEHGLLNEQGIFRETIGYEGVPRVAALVRNLDGTPIAHALFMPTTFGANGCAPVPKRYGSKAGIIGVFVAPHARGGGHAFRALSAIGEVIGKATVPREKMCVMAQGRVVPLVRSAMPIPVLSTWLNERAPEDRGELRFR